MCIHYVHVHQQMHTSFTAGLAIRMCNNVFKGVTVKYHVVVISVSVTERVWWYLLTVAACVGWLVTMCVIYGLQLLL